MFCGCRRARLYGTSEKLGPFTEGQGLPIRLKVIQTEGRIGSGFFGGSMSEAVDRAAEEIAEYAIANFK